MLKSFNAALYASSMTALVTAAGRMGEAATAHAGVVLVGFIEGTVTDETYLSALCQRAGVMSSKGKANANALETNGFGAAKRVYTDIKRIVKHLDIPGVALAVRGFAGYLPEWDGVELADDADAKAKAAHTRQLTQAIKAAYPDRPTSFAALVKAVTTAINAKAKADAEAAGETVEPETVGADASDILQGILETLQGIDQSVDGELLTAIASEIDRIAAIEIVEPLANVG